MYITDSNQYTIELVTYLLVFVVYFYEFIVYMLMERNAFDSIAFFPQCNFSLWITSLNSSFLIVNIERECRDENLVEVTSRKFNSHLQYYKIYSSYSIKLQESELRAMRMCSRPQKEPGRFLSSLLQFIIFQIQISYIKYFPYNNSFGYICMEITCL